MDNDELSEALDELQNEGGEIALSYEWGTGASRHRNNTGDIKERILTAFRDLQAEVDRLETENTQIVSLSKLIAEAFDIVKAKNLQLRAVLMQVEYVAHHTCPWCKGSSHKPDCPRQKALEE